MTATAHQKHQHQQQQQQQQQQQRRNPPPRIANPLTILDTVHTGEKKVTDARYRGLSQLPTSNYRKSGIPVTYRQLPLHRGTKTSHSEAMRLQKKSTLPLATNRRTLNLSDSRTAV